MPHPPPPERSWASPALAGAGIALATAAVYANSFSGPFVFDDVAAIVHNASIRRLGDLGAVLSPPSGNGITVDGRPVLNLSLALNYAISGTHPWSYHLLNLVIHAAAGLALYGIVRRTLPKWRGSFYPRAATGLAGLVALLWTVHPLQTESVTYVIQRAESLMGLFYWLTIYCFIRGSNGSAVEAAARRFHHRKSGEPPLPRTNLGFYGLSVIFCLLGMGTKEVMVSAPLIVLLYDRTFVSADLISALRKRWGYYLPLALTSGVVLALALKTGSRGGTSGFGIAIKPWNYWATQFQAVTHYLWLSFWPSPLIFDYGVRWSRGFTEYVPFALVVGALALATGVALWRRSAAGFLGAFLFAVLAPTSVVPGNRQTLAEHRMYLPLAAVIAFAVCGAYALIPAARRRRATAIGACAALAWAAVLGALTIRRNEDYRSALTLYADTVHKRPGNASAHDNWGNALRDAGRPDEAIAQFEAALQARPDYAEAEYNLAITLAGLGRSSEAIGHYEAALRLKPDYAEAQNNLGIALSRAGRDAEAIGHLSEAVRFNPQYVEAHYNLGLALARTGRMAEAESELETALRLNAGFTPATTALGYVRQILRANR